MTGTFEHSGDTFNWWAGSADTEDEWCVHCRNETYGVSFYLPNQPTEGEAETAARSLAPLVESIAVNRYTT